MACRRAGGATLRLGAVLRPPGTTSAARGLGAALRSQARGVTVWPQWPYDDKESHAKPVGDPRFRWPPTRSSQNRRREEKPPGTALAPRELEVARTKLNEQIWQDMVSGDWSAWERRFWEMKERAIPYDEGTYTLLMHGYLLSHRHSGERAYHVLAEMRKAEMHPALVRLNQRMLDSAFEMLELGHRPGQSLWRNVTRLCLHVSRRFQKKRRQRLRDELETLEPDDVLSLGQRDAQQWLRGHDRLELPPPSQDRGRARFLSLLQQHQQQKQLEGPTDDMPRLLGPGGDAGAPGAERSGRRLGRRRQRRAAEEAAELAELGIDDLDVELEGGGGAGGAGPRGGEGIIVRHGRHRRLRPEDFDEAEAEGQLRYRRPDDDERRLGAAGLEESIGRRRAAAAAGDEGDAVGRGRRRGRFWRGAAREDEE